MLESPRLWLFPFSKFIAQSQRQINKLLFFFQWGCETGAHYILWCLPYLASFHTTAISTSVSFRLHLSPILCADEYIGHPEASGNIPNRNKKSKTRDVPLHPETLIDTLKVSRLSKDRHNTSANRAAIAWRGGRSFPSGKFYLYPRNIARDSHGHIPNCF